MNGYCLLDVGSASTAGRRQDNQDRVAHFSSAFGHVFVLADGMGGCRGGAIASGLAVERLPGIMAGISDSLPADAALVASIQALNRMILEESTRGGDAAQGMGSTLVALLVRQTADGSLAIGAHVGDSRLYFLRGERLFGLTKDHTVVQELLQLGTLTPEQAADHPQSSVLTRALGREGNLAVDLTSWMMLQPGDTFVLCSDGLSGYAGEDAIRDVLVSGGDPNQTAHQLVELALRKGSRDNISVVIIRAGAAASAARLSD